MSEGSVKIAFSQTFIKCLRSIWPEVAVALVRRTSISPPSIRWRVASLILHARYAGTLFREHAPSENIRLLQQPSVITGMFTPTVFAT